MIYFFKRLISFWKTELVLLKSMNIVAVSLFFLLFFAVSTIEVIFYQHQKIYEILVFGTVRKFTIYQIAVNNKIIIIAVGILAFFAKLKQQNFFKHLVLNRNFFNAYFELFTFSLSIVSLLFVMHIPFIPFSELKQHHIFMIVNVNLLTIVVDLILLVNWNIIRYIFTKMIILSTTFTFYFLCIVKLNNTDFVSTQDFYGIVMSLNIIINLIITQRILSGKEK